MANSTKMLPLGGQLHGVDRWARGACKIVVHLPGELIAVFEGVGQQFRRWLRIALPEEERKLE